MQLKLLLFLSVICSLGCHNVEQEEIYRNGLNRLLLEIEAKEGNHFFNNKVCVVQTEDLLNDSEFKRYFEETYAKKGFEKLASPSIQFLKSYLTNHFNEVSFCSVMNSSISIREMCRVENRLCFGISDIYFNSEENEYFFAATFPPIGGAELKVSAINMEAAVQSINIK